MAKFYFLLWLNWAIRLSVSSVLLASLVSLIITFFIYLRQNFPPITQEVMGALYDITLFWFPLIWSITLLLALFRTLKYIFENCLNHYKFELLTCKLDSVISEVGYGDLVKVWRRWFILLIWLVATHMVVSLLITYIFSSFTSVFDWFDIYWLFAFTLSSGYFSFLLLGTRCKRVRVVKC